MSEDSVKMMVFALTDVVGCTAVDTDLEYAIKGKISFLLLLPDQLTQNQKAESCRKSQKIVTITSTPGAINRAILFYCGGILNYAICSTYLPISLTVHFPLNWQ
jgi:hypothetical protein